MPEHTKVMTTPEVKIKLRMVLSCNHQIDKENMTEEESNKPSLGMGVACEECAVIRYIKQIHKFRYYSQSVDIDLEKFKWSTQKD